MPLNDLIHENDKIRLVFYTCHSEISVHVGVIWSRMRLQPDQCGGCPSSPVGNEEVMWPRGKRRKVLVKLGAILKDTRITRSNSYKIFLLMHSSNIGK